MKKFQVVMENYSSMMIWYTGVLLNNLVSYY